jgi:hypothetical protein
MLMGGWVGGWVGHFVHLNGKVNSTMVTPRVFYLRTESGDIAQ